MKRPALPALLALALTSCPGCYANQCLPGQVVVVESQLIPALVSQLPTVPRSGVNAVTLGRTIYVDPRAAEDPRLICHELEHVAQRDSLGWRFFVAYVGEAAIHGYDGNRFELAADSAAARDC